jgi:hypothetical protein
MMEAVHRGELNTASLLLPAEGKVNGGPAVPATARSDNGAAELGPTCSRK